MNRWMECLDAAIEDLGVARHIGDVCHFDAVFSKQTGRSTRRQDLPTHGGECRSERSDTRFVVNRDECAWSIFPFLARNGAGQGRLVLVNHEWNPLCIQRMAALEPDGVSVAACGDDLVDSKHARTGFGGS